MNVYYLHGRQLGADAPWVMPRWVEERRIRELDVSREKNVVHYHDSGVKALDIDPVEGRYLLSGATDGGMAIFDVRNTSKTDKWTAPAVCTIEGKKAPGHQYSVSCVQWYPHDTGMFFTSSTDKTLKVWDANTLRVSEQFNFSHSVFTHHLSPMATSHCLIAVGCDDENIALCDMRSGSQSHVLRGHRESVLSVCWSPRSDNLLASGGCDHCILLWDVRKARSCVASLDQHNGKKASNVPHLGCLSICLYMYSFLSDCLLKLVCLTACLSVQMPVILSKYLSTGLSILSCLPCCLLLGVAAHNGIVTSLSFLVDGLHLLSFGRDNRLRLWDVLTSRNTLVNYGQVVNRCRTGCQFALSHCHTPGYAFIPSANNIQMFDIHEGKKIRTLKGHFQSVTSCTIHPYKQELYSCSTDCSVLVWSPSIESISKPDEVCHLEEQTVRRGVSYMEDTWSDDEDG